MKNSDLELRSPDPNTTLVTKKRARLPPLFETKLRFVGLLIFGILWVAVMLQGSNELFGHHGLLNDIMRGGGRGEIDVGFGGDYFGSGDLDDSCFMYDFGELVDVIQDLVKPIDLRY
jgi:hypothetical protein